MRLRNLMTVLVFAIAMLSTPNVTAQSDTAVSPELITKSDLDSVAIAKRRAEVKAHTEREKAKERAIIQNRRQEEAKRGAKATPKGRSESPDPRRQNLRGRE